MAKGKKVLKVFLWLLLAIVLAVGGVIAYIYFGDSSKRNPLTVIPDDAIYIIETNNLTDGWKKLNSSKIWNHLLSNKKFEDINKSAKSLDSIIKGNSTLDLVFSERKLLISAHLISEKDYDFLFAIDLMKTAKITFIKDYIKDIVAMYDFILTKRNFKGNEIMELRKVASTETISIAFVENIMVISYTPTLIEKALLQKDSKYWENDPYFKRAVSEIKDNKLFNFYINFRKLGSYLNCYLSENSELATSISNSLCMSAFNVNIEDSKLSLKGSTAINDSTPSYLKALSEVEPGKMGAFNIIPKNMSVFISMCFNDYNDFFDKLKSTFNANDTAKAENYDKTIKKAEKLMKVNLQEDFFSWIGNEISMVKLQPTSNSREEDVIAVFHAKNIDNAKTGLEHIMKQVKRRTLGIAKFDDTDYKNYKIHYFNVSGFFKLFFGKLFSKLERPYFTYIDDYVVFSNSPSCLMDFIDEYIVGNTLAHDDDFTSFMGDFEEKSNAFVYVQMPKMYSHLYYYSKPEKRIGIKDNKDLILSFTRIGFQLVSDDKKFKTNLVADFDENAAFSSELENIESAAEDLFLKEIDSTKHRAELSDKELKQQGSVKVLYPDNKTIKHEGRLDNGKLTGLWRSYFENGKIKSAINYTDDKANGIGLFYFNNDKQSTRAEINFEDDLITGIYREFYENGSRKATLNFEEGLPDGEAEFFYDSGVTKIEGTYKKGVKTGKWKHFSETGEIIDKEKWKKGKKKGEK
jgi:antitoxin component YwqK of YwqJK toxin-antitoxin module